MQLPFQTKKIYMLSQHTNNPSNARAAYEYQQEETRKKKLEEQNKKFYIKYKHKLFTQALSEKTDDTISELQKYIDKKLEEKDKDNKKFQYRIVIFTAILSAMLSIAINTIEGAIR